MLGRDDRFHERRVLVGDCSYAALRAVTALRQSADSATPDDWAGRQVHDRVSALSRPCSACDGAGGSSRLTGYNRCRGETVGRSDACRADHWTGRFGPRSDRASDSRGDSGLMAARGERYVAACLAGPDVSQKARARMKRRPAQPVITPGPATMQKCAWLLAGVDGLRGEGPGVSAVTAAGRLRWSAGQACATERTTISPTLMFCGWASA